MKKIDTLSFTRTKPTSKGGVLGKINLGYEIISVLELERRLFLQDGVFLLLRTNRNNTVLWNNRLRPIDDNITLSKYIRTRVRHLVCNDVHIDIYDGSMNIPNLRTTIKTLHKSYN